MATVEDAASLVLAAVDVSADRPIGIQLVVRWLNLRYQALVSRTRFRQLRKIGAITIPDAITAGAVTVTEGSTSVTADADLQTAITAAGGAGAIVGRHLRVHTVWYEIDAYAAPTITLTNAYTEEDETDAAFVLLPRFHALATEARWMGTFVYPRRRRRLRMQSLVGLDIGNPERQLTGDGPWYVAEATPVPSDTLNLGTAGAKRVELYPYSRTSETIYYTYWSVPTAFVLDDELPREIDPYVLVEGALIDLFRYRASQAANGGRIEEAGYWRNESRAQATSWERQIMDASKADRGNDDVSFIYHTLGLSSFDTRDIQTARDEVWARGSRP